MLRNKLLQEDRMLPVMRGDRLSMLRYVSKWGVNCEMSIPGGARVNFDLVLEKEEGEKLFDLLTEAAKRVENEEESEQ